MKDFLVVVGWIIGALLLFALAEPLREWSADLGLRWWHGALVGVAFAVYGVARSVDRLQVEVTMLRNEVRDLSRRTTCDR